MKRSSLLNCTFINHYKAAEVKITARLVEVRTRRRFRAIAQRHIPWKKSTVGYEC